MASLGNIKGALLEVILLYLLRLSGYRTVTTYLGDDTLCKAQNGGIAVKGRGEKHEIDAIADFRIQYPFSYPQRLLVEAKCFTPPEKVGIPIAREAVGVLKDVNEYWIGANNHTPTKRYHYQYAIFSATGYSVPAQKYSYAQDIYLISLQNSKFFKPILDIIHSISPDDFGIDEKDKDNKNIDINLSEMRRKFREFLAKNDISEFEMFLSNEGKWDGFKNKIRKIHDITKKLNYGLLAVIGNRFPVMLIPNTESDDLKIDNLNTFYRIEIKWDKDSWYIYDHSTRKILFSFDLPPELFDLYQENGVLTRIQAIRLKKLEMAEFYAYKTIPSDEESSETVKIVRFVIDKNWYNNIKEDVERMKHDTRNREKE